MKYHHSWLALMLASCGGEAPQVRACDRLGLLCADELEARVLTLGASRNVTADLDGDGALDLVTAGYSAGLSVAWAAPARREYRLFSGLVPDAKIGDVDDDGQLDIVFLTSEPAALHILTGAGKQQFTDGPTRTLAGTPRALWLGQLDADGKLDAAVVSGDDGTLTLVTDGLTRAVPTVFGRDLAAIDAGDFNDDGRLDLVALDNGDAAFYLLLADGDGFAPPRRVPTGLAPLYLQLYDLDGDKRLDVLTHGKGPEIWFHQGDAAGGFAPAHALKIQDAPSPGFAAHRDDQGRRWLINIDYKNIAATLLDDDDQIAGRVRSGGEVEFTGLDVDAGLLLGHGNADGVRYELVPSVTFSELWHGGLYTEYDPLLVDLDQDGEVELVTTLDDAIVIHHQQPDASWLETSRLAVTPNTVARAAADLTGDGLTDLVLVDNQPALTVAVGADDGSFTLAPATPVAQAPIHLLTTASPEGTSVVFSSNGIDPGLHSLRFTADGLAIAEPESLLFGAINDVTAADLDADGRDDLVALVVDIESTSVTLVPATADGWGPPRPRALPADALYAYTLAVGDLDLDGKQDLATFGATGLLRFMDVAAEPPTPPELDPLTISPPETLNIADADADGRPDLIAVSRDGLTVVRATPDGEWEPQPPFNSYFINWTIHVDPDDQRPLAAMADSGALTVATTDLAIAFDPVGTFQGGASQFDNLVTGDLDADGHTDLVASGYTIQKTSGTSNYTVLWGHPDGRPQRATWVDGRDLGSIFPLLAPLDDRPGDELLIARQFGDIEVWTHDDGALQLAFATEFTDLRLAAVAMQARPGGRSDLLVLTISDEQWRLLALPRTKTGDFTDPASAVTLWSAPTGKRDPQLLVADFDADGHDDIAVLSEPYTPVQVLWGNKDRKPVATDILTPPAYLYNFAQADMDDDGTPELILGTDVGVLGYHLDDRVQSELTTYVASSAEQGLLIADLEQDGRADILRTDEDHLNLTVRTTGDDERVQLRFNPAWFRFQAARLDDDDILDFAGLYGSYLLTRLSAPQEAPAP